MTSGIERVPDLVEEADHLLGLHGRDDGTRGFDRGEVVPPGEEALGRQICQITLFATSHVDLVGSHQARSHPPTGQGVP